MIATIHQPENFPWLGFIDKALKADLFILLDDVQYEKNYFQNRNRIRTADGWQWVTIPAKLSGRTGQLIRDVEIANEINPRWREKHLASWTQNYGAAPHAARWLPVIRALYERPWEKLADFNIAVIGELFSAFGVTARVVRSSELASTGKSTEKLVSLCRSAGAGEYLSGISGHDYLDESLFAAGGIKLSYHDFRHPIYKQRHEPFEPCMSAFDLLFNEGPRSRDILLDPSWPRVEKAFT